MGLIHKKIDGYIAATPFHLFALTCLFINQRRTQHDRFRHLIVLNQFDNVDQIPNRLLKLGLIDKVSYVDPYYQTGNVNAVSYFFCYVFKRNSAKKAFLKQNPMLKDIWNCSSLYIAYPSKLVLDIKDYLCPEAEIILYDDGVGSYTGGILNHFAFSHLSRRSIRKAVHAFINFMTIGHYHLDPKLLLAFNPEFVCFDRTVPITVHSIERPEMKCAREIFSDCIDDTGNALDAVVLGTSHDSTEYNRAVDVLKSISSYVDNSLQIIYRPHPRNLYPNEYPGFMLDQKRAPWELLCLFGGINDETVLIGFGSSALVFPKMIFDLEPTIVSLHELYSSNCSEFRSLLQKVRLNYSDQTKIYAPKTMEEVFWVLDRLLDRKHG